MRSEYRRNLERVRKDWSALQGRAAKESQRLKRSPADELGMRLLVAHCHLSLGKLYRHTGDHWRAQEHPHVAANLENYADLLQKMNRAAEATELEARAKAIRAKHAKENPAK